MTTRVTLPSIQEMFPDHLLGLKSPIAHAPRIVHPPHSPASPSYPTSPASRSPRAEPREPGVRGSRERSGSGTGERDDDRRHACPECGKAFNRPSSLAIHVNTHTGAKPFECPFPGCGRRFNVNSNMRRHFRNHTSHRPLGASSPYTHPLTTAPRSLSSYAFSPATPHVHSSSNAGRCRGSEDTDEEDELSSGESACSYGGRSRGYSTSSVPQREGFQQQRGGERERVERRPRAHTYAARPTVLHPSSEAFRRALAL